MKQYFTTIEEAEHFVMHLKRSDNWISNDELHIKLMECYTLISKQNRNDLLPYVCVHLALYHIDLGEYGKAWDFTEEGRKHAEPVKNYDPLLNCISLQYRVQRYLGNIDKAQELVNEQLQIALESKDNLQIYSAYLNKAYQEHLRKDKIECLKSFKIATDYCLKTKNKYYIALNYVTYSAHLIDFNDFNQAKGLLETGIELATENNFEHIISLGLTNLSLVHENNKEYVEAINCLKKSIALFEKKGNANEEAQAKLMLIQLYLNLNDLESSETLLNETLEFSTKFNIKTNISTIYKYYSILYEKKQNYILALEFYKKHTNIKEEIFSQEARSKMENLEIIQRLNLLRVEKNNALKLATIKHDFLANMSHEIRTPINSILGICYLLNQRITDDISSNYIKRLEYSGIGLLGIINDILDISKIESGKMEFNNEEFSLKELVRNSFSALEGKANINKIDYQLIEDYPLNTILIGDQTRIFQIINNLLSNAIKFTPNGKVIFEVNKVESENQNECKIELLVIDNGIGIAKDKLEKIFDQYEQADKTINNKFGGTGLGLSITKKIVELLQGEIDVESVPEERTCFKIILPFKERSAQKETIKHINTTNNFFQIDTKIDILIADDNEEARDVLKAIIQSISSNIIILEAENGQIAIDIFRNHKPKVIIIDMEMPILDGWNAVQQLRKEIKHKETIIIGNTSSLILQSQSELHDFGFDYFLNKPYKPEVLLNLLMDCLKN